jgi:hypothetical protein
MPVQSEVGASYSSLGTPGPLAVKVPEHRLQLARDKQVVILWAVLATASSTILPSTAVGGDAIRLFLLRATVCHPVVRVVRSAVAVVALRHKRLDPIVPAHLHRTQLVPANQYRD